MVILQDTREKEGKKDHILKVWERQGFRVVRTKLNYGDYMIYGKEYISVDLKQDVMEIVGNITKQHTRFRKELENAQIHGVKLIVLIEEPLKSIYSLQYWKSPIWKYGKNKGKPITQMKGETILKILLSLQQKYGCLFMFCDKKDSANKILEILTKG